MLPYKSITTAISTIKQKPIDIWNNVVVNDQKITRVEPNLQVGDTVRVMTKKKIFDEGDALKTSKTLYTIVEKVGKRYKLKNISTGNYIKRLYPHFELVPKSANFENENGNKIEIEKPEMALKK